MYVLKKQNSYRFTSDEKSSAKNVRDFGSTFDTTLPSPLDIPPNALGCEIEVISSTIPYIMPNISAEIGNNHFYVEYGLGGYTDIIIPDGLYGPSQLAAAISREFSANGIPSTLLTFIGDLATQRMIIQFNEDANIDFTQANTFRYILGYDSQIVVGVAGEYVTGEDIARFNSLTGWNISSSLINHGIPTNGSYVGVLSDVPIITSPGKINIYNPVRPSTVNASELIGTRLTNLTFYLRDQNNQTVELLGETWFFTLLIRYYVPVPLSVGSSSSHF